MVQLISIKHSNARVVLADLTSQAVNAQVVSVIDAGSRIKATNLDFDVVEDLSVVNADLTRA